MSGIAGAVPLFIYKSAEKGYTINNYANRGGEQMAEQELEQLEGTVEDIIYENADNGYTVFDL